MTCLMRFAAIVAVSAVASMPAATAAQDFPNRAIRMVAPIPPGGGVDIIARSVSAKLTEKLGVPVVVDNRAGGAGVIGSDYVAKAAPDGYTLLMGYSAHATNPLFIEKMPYDSLKDFAGVIQVGYIPLLLVVHPSVPAKSVGELIALAKSKPGQLSFASGGPGGGPFLAGVLLNYLADVKTVHVPYKGNAPALNDLLGGHVPMMFDTITTSLPHAKSGQLRMLAVTSAQRSGLAPDVPTMEESGLKGFDVRAWFVVFAPAGTPRDIVRRLNAEINAILRDPDFRARSAKDGIELVGGTPEEADAFVRTQSETWQRVLKAVGTVPELVR